MKSERKQRPNSFARRRTTMPATEAAPTSNAEGKPTTEEPPATTECNTAALKARVEDLERRLAAAQAEGEKEDMKVTFICNSVNCNSVNCMKYIKGSEVHRVI